MSKNILILLAILFSIKGVSFSAPVLEMKDYIFYIDSYARVDVVSFKNVVDLDDKNSDDTTTYLGIDYNLGFKYEPKVSGPKFYLKLERSGPGDYNAPLFIHNTLINSGGRIEKYRNEELLPQVEEFWLDTPLIDHLGFKAGLYAYEVGNVFSLNGSYENYGFTLYRELENFIWSLYYCRPDVVYKNRLGPRIDQEREQGYIYNHNASNFFATDAKFNVGRNSFQPYIGILADYTSPGKRENSFTAPIKKDILGTWGLAWDLKQDKLGAKAELAHNFGRAESDDPDYKDIYHTGYLVYTEGSYKINKITPSLKFLLASGNKVTLDMVANEDSTLTSAKNRAFSSSSPFNDNLGDSISGCNADMRPVVAMGSGYGLHYGLPRPKTFAASDFDNLVTVCLSFNLEATKKLNIILDGYYLRSLERGVGMLDGEARYLARDLGYEVDLFVDYQLDKNVVLSFLGGYFLPGRHYKEKRDDTTGSLFSPYVRGDGFADPAYQVELSLELTF